MRVRSTQGCIRTFYNARSTSEPRLCGDAFGHAPSRQIKAAFDGRGRFPALGKGGVLVPTPTYVQHESGRGQGNSCFLVAHTPPRQPHHNRYSGNYAPKASGNTTTAPATASSSASASAARADETSACTKRRPGDAGALSSPKNNQQTTLRSGREAPGPGRGAGSDKHGGNRPYLKSSRVAARAKSLIDYG